MKHGDFPYFFVCLPGRVLVVFVPSPCRISTTSTTSTASTTGWISYFALVGWVRRQQAKPFYEEGQCLDQIENQWKDKIMG